MFYVAESVEKLIQSPRNLVEDSHSCVCYLEDMRKKMVNAFSFKAETVSLFEATKHGISLQRLCLKMHTGTPLQAKWKVSSIEVL